MQKGTCPEMATSARVIANAANAQHSTGPRTTDGKARSAQNAMKHGLTSKELVVREDEQEEFESLRGALIEEIAPHGVLESLAFAQFLQAAWNLQRFRRLEGALAVDGVDPLLEESAAKTLDRLRRYAASAERSYYRAMKELRT